MKGYSPANSIEEAFDRTVSLLWPPCPGIWVRIALLAIFLGGVMTNPFGTGDFSELSDPGRTEFFSPDILTSYMHLIMLAGAGLVTIGLVYVIMSSIFQFVFVDCLSSGTILLTRTIPMRWGKGLRLVGFYLVLFFLIIIGTCTITLLFIVPSFLAKPTDVIHLLMVIVESLILLFIILIPVWILAILTADFVVPIMIVDDTGIISGWIQVITMFSGRWMEAGIYTGLKIILIIISGIILGILTFLVSIPLGLTGTILTPGTGFNLLMDPQSAGPIFLGTGAMILISLLFLVPVVTFFRYYSLAVLRDLDQKYNLLPDILQEPV